MQKNKIFISYRQSDTQSEASRLKENLEDIFGADRVFFDIETLEPGLNFAKAIEKTLFQSAVVLVLIGESWIDVKDEDGNLRLFKEDDWVRKEVAMALAMDDTRVIPVLVKDAKKLSASQLPDNIKSLADFQWAELTIPRWREDVDRLAKSLEKIITPLKKKPYPPIPPKSKSWWARNYLWILGIFVALLILGLWPTEDANYDNYYDDEQIGEDLSQADINTLREGNPTGTDIYDSFQLDSDPVPDQTSPAVFNYSGKWWLWQDGIRMGYFLIKQNGYYFNYDYYYFDEKTGYGTGEFDGSYLYSTSFIMYNDPNSNYGFNFESLDGGISWAGNTYYNTAPTYTELRKGN
jgi:hypothetical protein